MSLFTDADRLRWVSTGQRVTLDVGGGRGLTCVVLTAAGHTAYVAAANPNTAFKPRWVDVLDLFPEVTPELRLSRIRSLPELEST